MILLKKKSLVACIYILLISQMLLFVSAFSDDLNYVVEYNENLTPFSVMPIFFENVPKDVHSINVLIEVGPEYKQQHFAHYPILESSEKPPFSLIHFLWLLDENFLESLKNPVEESTVFAFDQKPTKIKIKVKFDHPLTPYSELLKINYNQTDQVRVVDEIWTRSKNNNQSIKTNNKKAIIFIHGLHGGTYNNILEVVNSSKTMDWRANYLEKYWEKYYLFDDADYFEFQYDTFFNDAEHYGNRLAELTQKASIFDTYEKIYLITYSLGTIVGQYFLNADLNRCNGFVGDRIENFFIIGSLLEGSYLINLTDYVSTNISSEQSLTIINTCDTKRKEEIVISMISQYQSLLEIVNRETIGYILENMFEFYKQFPILFCAAVMSFDDIPVLGGQIVPYIGVKSMRYTSDSFLKKMEDALGFKRDTFITNDKLRNLNINNAFKEKTIIFSTYIQDAEEIIKRISTFAGYILNFVDSPAITQEADNLRDVEAHAIPILEYIVQRLLNIMLTSFATTIGELNHVLNDGLVTVWSQQMTPHKDGLLEENIFVLYNVDHKNIIDSGIVINTIKSIINKQ